MVFFEGVCVCLIITDDVFRQKYGSYIVLQISVGTTTVRVYYNPTGSKVLQEHVFGERYGFECRQTMSKNSNGSQRRARLLCALFRSQNSVVFNNEYMVYLNVSNGRIIQ